MFAVSDRVIIRTIVLPVALCLLAAACEAHDPSLLPDYVPPVGVDCDALKPLPVKIEEITGVVSDEDFAFDGEGRLVSLDSAGNVVASTRDGDVSVLSAGVTTVATGVAYLPDGDLVIADIRTDLLLRMSPNGGVEIILGDLRSPNGVEVHPDGWIYVSEQDAGQVRRVDPDSGDFEVIMDGVPFANGISFAPDYSRIYVASYTGYSIHVQALDEQGMPIGEKQIWYGNITNVDGLGVDLCGNVYFTEYVAGTLWRYDPDGLDLQKVADFPTSWIPNMDFGSGLGGWSRDRLYVNSRGQDTVWELDLGVPGRPRAYVP